jgi:catechol 2,3-dioxygenase-like lactoylglutathione lyase family enzyme
MEDGMIDGLDGIEAITLFAEDLAAARRFYEDVFGLTAVFEDAVSAAYRFGSQLLNVLQAAQAPELVTPLAVGAAGQGPRLMFTIHVANVDAICAEFGRHGVVLLNGPIDRPWGRRTAAFRDPAGMVWEVAHDL